MVAAKHLELISVEDYLAGELVSPIKHEYTGGHVYAMAGGRNVHNMIAGAFIGRMYSKLGGKPCRPFNSDTKVRVRFANHTRFYYPDGMVVCDKNPQNDTFQDSPAVIAEVISASTRRIDEGEKRDAYLSIPTLSAYLRIESDRPRVIVHHRTDSGFEARQYDGLDAIIPLDGIGTELELSALYDGVDFTEADPDLADPDAGL